MRSCHSWCNDTLDAAAYVTQMFGGSQKRICHDTDQLIGKLMAQIEKHLSKEGAWHRS